MNTLNYKEALEMLKRAGYTRAERERLCSFRRTYVKHEVDQAGEDMCYLNFIRWLVSTGKLTEQIETQDTPGENQPAGITSDDARREKEERAWTRKMPRN